jgi:hypothetical protein
VSLPDEKKGPEKEPTCKEKKGDDKNVGDGRTEIALEFFLENGKGVFHIVNFL